MATMHRTTTSFPVFSPAYEVCQMRRTKQKSVEQLEPGDIVRFATPHVQTGRGSGRGLYSTDFVIERREEGNWVPRSVPMGQGVIARRILIVLSGDPYDEGLFESGFRVDKPLVVLRPAHRAN